MEHTNGWVIVFLFFFGLTLYYSNRFGYLVLYSGISNLNKFMILNNVQVIDIPTEICSNQWDEN